MGVKNRSRSSHWVLCVTLGEAPVAKVAPELEGILEWGSREWSREIRGCLAIIDETEDRGKGSQESGMTSVSFVPSLKGLLFLLGHAGFERAEVLQPGPDAHEQHLRGRRVMIAAFPGKF